MSGVKLTKAQRDRLAEIASFKQGEWPHAAFWPHSRTDQSLVKRGLVHRIEHRKKLGGIETPMGGISVTWHLCDLTPTGRSALEANE